MVAFPAKEDDFQRVVVRRNGKDVRPPTSVSACPKLQQGRSTLFMCSFSPVGVQQFSDFGPRRSSLKQVVEIAR